MVLLYFQVSLSLYVISKHALQVLKVPKRLLPLTMNTLNGCGQISLHLPQWQAPNFHIVG